MTIRHAKKTDLRAIQKVIEAAFSEGETESVIRLAADLCREVSIPPVLSLVAEIDHHLVGYMSCSPVFFSSDVPITGYIVAPLAVLPHHQKTGLGTSLMKTGVAFLSGGHVDVLLVYGDPAYYGRFGFKAETARPFIPPYPLKYPFGWLGMTLTNIDLAGIDPADSDPVKTEHPFNCVKSLSKAELW